jgi:hypothetical protein
LITASEGETTALSSMKSPRCESSSSPIGVSRRDRLLRDLQNFAHFGDGNIHALGDFFGRGLAAKFLHQLRLVRPSLLIVSIMCTGMRMVRA